MCFGVSALAIKITPPSAGCGCLRFNGIGARSNSGRTSHSHPAVTTFRRSEADITAERSRQRDHPETA
jgi:hypothetical protein